MTARRGGTAGGPGRRAVYEPIVPSLSESFVWRCDDYPRPWSVWNFHPEYEVHLVRRSSGTCYVGDHIGPFSPGSLYLIGENLPHDWTTPLGASEVVAERDVLIQFRPERLLAASETLPELKRISRLLREAGRGLAFHGRARRDGGALAASIGGATGLRRLALFLELLDLMATTGESTPLSSETFTPNLDDRVNTILRAALGRLASRLHEDIRLSELADAAGMTETSFSRFFKKNTGNTFTRHLGELRVGKACQLLADTDRAVTDVCHEVGYGNLSNFNRAFRELRGMTPTQYRRSAMSRRPDAAPAGQDDGRSVPARTGQDNIGAGHGGR